MTMNHSFQRYTGAGNTFVVMNTYEDPLSLSRSEMRALVQKLCSYKEGPGGDGLILINQSSTAPFRMDFYNPDGSTGMLCGNGARCAVRAARDYGLCESTNTSFEVLGSNNRAEILSSGLVKVYFQDPRVIRLNVSLDLGSGELLKGYYVDVGSQHFVIFFDDLKPLGEADIETMNIRHFGPSVRWHPEFARTGVNANFIEVREDGEEKYLRIRTFERGVEGETLACGTGCMSAAIVAYRTGRITKTPIRLLTQSGEYVTVDFTQEGERITNLSLEGSAVKGEDGRFTFDESSSALTIEYL
jgi:diaminopimelate epimerase